jgi:hypothetical protein
MSSVGNPRRLARKRNPPATRHRALELLASCREGCSEAILRAHRFIIEQLRKRTTQFLLLFFGLPLFVFLVLALAQGGSGSSCHWAFPKWFGCVLAAHENLAGGLIGLAGVLLGAWAAWSAVQHQINADRERAMADRVEADRLLSEALTDYAEGMAAAWRRLAALPQVGVQLNARAVYEATAYMAERVSRSELIANYRAMADTLGWDRRMKYGALLRGLDELRQFRDPKSIQDDPQEALNLIRRLADDFEYCLPDTSSYFEGLWRRSHKAMTFADWVERIATRGS